MKQALINLLNNALHPFGLHAVPLQILDDLGLAYHEHLHDRVKRRWGQQLEWLKLEESLKRRIQANQQMSWEEIYNALPQDKPQTPQ